MKNNSPQKVILSLVLIVINIYFYYQLTIHFQLNVGWFIFLFLVILLSVFTFLLITRFFTIIKIIEETKQIDFILTIFSIPLLKKHIELKKIKETSLYSNGMLIKTIKTNSVFIKIGLLGETELSELLQIFEKNKIPVTKNKTAMDINEKVKCTRLFGIFFEGI